jgi:hypothetical protein
MCESCGCTPCKTCGAPVEDGVCSGCWEPAEECICPPVNQLQEDGEEELDDEYEEKDEEDYP